MSGTTATPVYKITKIIPYDDTNIPSIAMDERYRFATLVAQPLTLADDTLELEELLTEANAADATATGTVSLQVSPPRCFQKYDLSGGTIDLANPSFTSTDIPIGEVHPVFTNVAGCTHIAVTILGYSK